MTPTRSGRSGTLRTFDTKTNTSGLAAPNTHKMSAYRRADHPKVPPWSNWDQALTGRSRKRFQAPQRGPRRPRRKGGKRAPSMWCADAGFIHATLTTPFLRLQPRQSRASEWKNDGLVTTSRRGAGPQQWMPLQHPKRMFGIAQRLTTERSTSWTRPIVTTSVSTPTAFHRTRRGYLVGNVLEVFEWQRACVALKGASASQCWRCRRQWQRN